MIRKKIIVENFPGRNLGDIWYNLKKSFSYFKKFFWATWWFREYDSTSSLELLKIAIGEHLKASKIGHEISETRIPKEKKMERAIELIDNILIDNFSERCGYDYNYKTFFIPYDKDSNLHEMKSDATKEQNKNNDKAIKNGFKLENDEWREMTNILNDEMRKWWT